MFGLISNDLDVVESSRLFQVIDMILVYPLKTKFEKKNWLEKFFKPFNVSQVVLKISLYERSYSTVSLKWVSIAKITMWTRLRP